MRRRSYSTDAWRFMADCSMREIILPFIEEPKPLKLGWIVISHEGEIDLVDQMLEEGASKEAINIAIDEYRRCPNYANEANKSLAIMNEYAIAEIETIGRW